MAKKSAKKRVTSLKVIVAAIDKVLEEIGEGKPAPQGVYSERARVKKALKGIRETVESLCAPGFDGPPPEP